MSGWNGPKVLGWIRGSEYGLTLGEWHDFIRLAVDNE
jgi:hypothetical protein